MLAPTSASSHRTRPLTFAGSNVPLSIVVPSVDAPSPLVASGPVLPSVPPPSLTVAASSLASGMVAVSVPPHAAAMSSEPQVNFIEASEAKASASNIAHILAADDADGLLSRFERDV